MPDAIPKVRLARGAKNPRDRKVDSKVCPHDLRQRPLSVQQELFD